MTPTQKTPGFERQQGIYSEKTIEFQGTKIPLLIYPCADSTQTTAQNTKLKARGPQMSGDSLINLETNAGETGTSRDSHWVQRQSVSRISFAILRYLADISTSKCHLEFHL